MHATGLNWESIGIILGSIASLLGVVLAFVMWRQNQQKDEITSAITSLERVLVEKLETKENVNQMRVELARVSERVDSLLMKGSK